MSADGEHSRGQCSERVLGRLLPEGVTYKQLQFGVVPNDEVLVPFLTAFAKAAIHMHQLKKAALWTQVPFDRFDLRKEYIPEIKFNGRTIGPSR